MPKTLQVNNRAYGFPNHPTVILCLDGLDERYIDAALSSGAAPFLHRLRQRQHIGTARSAMPSFTNPNNLSIVTGVPPCLHGIAGNYFLDLQTGEEIMMNDPKFLRAETILAAFGKAGMRVGVVTAKDKLRRLLGSGLPIAEGRCICFSAERMHDVTPAEHGLQSADDLIEFDIPSVYSSEVSEAVLAAGVALLRAGRAELIYLSTTDYIQHAFAPDAPEAIAFVTMIDRYLSALNALGASFIATADHGMNAKTASDGSPNCLYLESLLEERLPEARARAILPITDPYVRHHGALGSFASLYLAEREMIAPARALLEGERQVDCVLTKEEAAAQLELPADRIGDLCVLATAAAVLGSRPENHDLSELNGPLRSHGGRHEQKVPFITNRPIRADFQQEGLRNFDAFHVALNGLELPRNG